MDLFSDWFNQLLITNEIIQKERVEMMPSLAVPTPVVELIFLQCSVFCQPHEVRYLTVELFDRFIRLHFKDLLEKVWSKGKELTMVREQWKKVESKLHTQVSLRMLSCIQLASKFTLHTIFIRPSDIQKHLNAEGKAYTLAMILASEIRVWKTLKFKLNIPTVLTYAEMLLEQLKLLPHLHSALKYVDEKVILLTDIVYLHHQEIYHKLFYLSTGRWEATKQEKQEFLPTECNVLYRAAAVVALSLTFVVNDFEDIICKELGLLINLPSKDIQVLANVINQVVFS